MKYGETVEGKCKYCKCKYFFLLEKKAEYMVGSKPKVYLKVMCKRCNTVQLIKK